MSITERLWLAADSIAPPYANQMVLESDDPLDEGRWTAAVEKACEAHPGTRTVGKGRLLGSHWVDSGRPAPVVSVDGSNWDGTSSSNAEFLHAPLDPKNGPSCDVLLVHGSPNRVIFRTHHGVTDWRGALFWIEDVFRALRGEKPDGSSSRLTDKALQKKHLGRFKGYAGQLGAKPYVPKFGAPTGFAEGHREGFCWHRASARGRFPALLPQVILRLAEQVARHSANLISIEIPVDLRDRVKLSEPALTNLTGIMRLEVPYGSTVESIGKDIQNQLRHGAFWKTLAPDWMMALPIRTVAASMRRMNRFANLKGRYASSGAVSNLGRIQQGAFECDGFRPQRVFSIPPCPPWGVPLFVTLVGFGEHLEVVMQAPHVLSTSGRLERLLAEVMDGLQSKP